MAAKYRMQVIHQDSHGTTKREFVLGGPHDGDLGNAGALRVNFTELVSDDPLIAKTQLILREIAPPPQSPQQSPSTDAAKSETPTDKPIAKQSS